MVSRWEERGVGSESLGGEGSEWERREGKWMGGKEWGRVGSCWEERGVDRKEEKGSGWEGRRGE